MNYDALKSVALFRSIEPRELEELLLEFHVSETSFKKGDILAMQDEPCNRLIILLSGSARGEMGDASGKVVKVDDIEAPSPLAILFLFGPDNRFPVTATASADGTALIIPRQAVLKMLARNETLLKNYLYTASAFAARLSRKLHFMSFRTIRQKLAMYFLSLARETGGLTLHPDKTHAALAEYFGVSRQALERELKRMTADALICANGKAITILDKQELARMVSS